MNAYNGGAAGMNAKAKDVPGGVYFVIGRTAVGRLEAYLKKADGPRRGFSDCTARFLGAMRRRQNGEVAAREA